MRRSLAAWLLWVMAGLLLMPCPGESASEPQCHLYPLPGCPRNFNPVCGTDGATYANECMLCMTNRERDTDVQIDHMSSCE